MTHPLTKLQADLEGHIKEEEKKWDELLRQQKLQSDAIRGLAGEVTVLAKAVKELTAATEDLVLTWKVLNALQRFFKWLSGFGIIGGLILWCEDIVSWVVKKFGGS